MAGIIELVRFEFFTAVLLRILVMWDAMVCCCVKCCLMARRNVRIMWSKTKGSACLP